MNSFSSTIKSKDQQIKRLAKSQFKQNFTDANNPSLKDIDDLQFLNKKTKLILSKNNSKINVIIKD
jgi:hypothetical protein